MRPSGLETVTGVGCLPSASRAGSSLPLRGQDLPLGQGSGSHAEGRASRALASCPQWAVELVSWASYVPKAPGMRVPEAPGVRVKFAAAQPTVPWPCPSMRPLSRPKAWEVVVDALGPGCEGRFL